MKDRTIVTCIVYEEMELNSASRVIGWWNTLGDAIVGLGHFGDECRWSYALFEEFYEGFHPYTKQRMWMKYVDSEWQLFDPEESDFTRCINHAIG
jgi:hypothetical protein